MGKIVVLKKIINITRSAWFRTHVNQMKNVTDGYFSERVKLNRALNRTILSIFLLGKFFLNKKYKKDQQKKRVLATFLLSKNL